MGTKALVLGTSDILCIMSLDARGAFRKGKEEGKGDTMNWLYGDGDECIGSSGSLSSAYI